jgi:AraC-like DNA-binding protein
MQDELLANVARYSNACANQDGIAALPIAGMNIVRATQPSLINFAVYKPLVALVLQGAKSVSVGASEQEFGAGESLIVTAEIPTISQVVRASPAKPYFSFITELDLSVLRELSFETLEVDKNPSAVNIEQTDLDVAATANRIMHLVDRPDALKALGQSLKRELHYWLINGRHMKAIGSITKPGSQFTRISEVMSYIRLHYTEPQVISDLAQRAGMSPTSFHQHFRAVTKLTPLQYQKQLRLIEARRAMLQDGRGIATVAYAVGYESVPQFTREYARFFGSPPGRDMRVSAALKLAL